MREKMKTRLKGLCADNTDFRDVFKKNGNPERALIRRYSALIKFSKLFPDSCTIL